MIEALQEVRRSIGKPLETENTPACIVEDLNLVRALSMEGIPCLMVTHPDTLSLFCRYTRAVLDRPLDPEDGKQFVESLVHLGSVQPQRPVLFYVSDLQLLFVSRFRKRLQTVFRFVIADPPLVENTRRQIQVSGIGRATRPTDTENILYKTSQIASPSTPGPALSIRNKTPEHRPAESLETDWRRGKGVASRQCRGIRKNLACFS